MLGAVSRSTNQPPATIAWLALCAALVFGACGGAGQAATPAGPTAPAVGPPAPAVDSLAAQVSVSQASALRDAGAFVLDVREPHEWAAGHIPDATLIPLGQLAGRLADVPHDRTIVVVCRSGNRSAEGRDILRRAGLAAVTSMSGGMNDWAAAGLPVTIGP